MAGQVASNLLSPAPNSYASSTDPVALFTKSIKQEPKDFPVIKLLNQWDSVKCAVNANGYRTIDCGGAETYLHSFCGEQTLVQPQEQLLVQHSDDTTSSTKPMNDSTDDDVVNDIMGQFDVDFDTLCIHVAERKQEELKVEEKHPHH
jgi:hypothetical protein